MPKRSKRRAVEEERAPSEDDEDMSPMDTMADPRLPFGDDDDEEIDSDDVSYAGDDDDAEPVDESVRIESGVVV